MSEAARPASATRSRPKPLPVAAGSPNGGRGRRASTDTSPNDGRGRRGSTDPRTVVPAEGWRAGVEAALIVLGLVGMAIGVPHRIWGDGGARYIELVELLDNGRLSDDSYSMIGPVFAVPLWFLGKVVWGPDVWLASFNLLLFTVALAVTYGLLRDRMDRALLRRVLLLLTAGTLIAAHVVGFYGEVFTAAFVALGILVAIARPARPSGWIMAVIGAANTPASMIGLGLISAERALRNRRLRYLCIVAAGVAIVLAEAWIRRGSPFITGYEHDSRPKTVVPYSGETGFSYPFVLGVFAILLSFGRGLVFFIPGLLLPVRRRLAELHDSARLDLYRVYQLWMLFLAGLVIVYASWWAWYGGIYWGPRFFLIGIFPASLALAVALTYERASVLADVGTLAVLALSIWVAASSSIFHDTQPLPFCYDPVMEKLCHFAPEYSQLWYPFVVKPHLGAGKIAYLAYFAIVFGYLATPVAARLVRKVTPRAKSLAALLAPAYWRF